MEEIDNAPSLVDLLRSTAHTESAAFPDRSSSPVAAYLDRLSSLPLVSIAREPFDISSENSSVEAELTNLCFREYPTFISVYKCSAAVQMAFDDFDGCLTRLIDCVPALEEECADFGQKTASVQAIRRRASTVQDHADILLELLELPQLMDACVRNGHYQEALELADHAEGFNTKYVGVALVQDVAKEVERVIQLMLIQLLALLREPLKLPTLVKAVAFLRRLGSVMDTDLGMIFLMSRLHNFRAQLIHIGRDRDDPVRYLRRHVDLFREHVYDIISQYTAIFQDQGHLSSFIGQCVTDLARLVTLVIPRIAQDAAAMSSILVQLGYCASSFARVGLDFSTLITEVFSATVLTTFSQTITVAGVDFTATLRVAEKNALLPSKVLASPDVTEAVLDDSFPDPSPTSHDGSQYLGHFPPLAMFYNSHVNAFNTLRLLAPLPTRSQIKSIHTSALMSATSSVLRYVQQAAVENLANSRETDRPKHSRTPSSPRAHLLRRNTETQMTLEVRAARRRETSRVCLAFARAWAHMACILLRHVNNILECQEDLNPAWLAKLGELEAWIEAGKQQQFRKGEKDDPIAHASQPIFHDGQNGHMSPVPVGARRLTFSPPPVQIPGATDGHHSTENFPDGYSSPNSPVQRTLPTSSTYERHYGANCEAYPEPSLQSEGAPGEAERPMSPEHRLARDSVDHRAGEREADANTQHTDGIIDRMFSPELVNERDQTKVDGTPMNSKVGRLLMEKGGIADLSVIPVSSEQLTPSEVRRHSEAESGVTPLDVGLSASSPQNVHLLAEPLMRQSPLRAEPLDPVLETSGSDLSMLEEKDTDKIVGTISRLKKKRRSKV